MLDSAIVFQIGAAKRLGGGFGHAVANAVRMANPFVFTNFGFQARLMRQRHGRNRNI
jgi:hypothetical protein